MKEDRIHTWLNHSPGRVRRGIVVVLAALVCCGAMASAQTASAPRLATPVRIAAAADLQPVLPPVLRAFEQETGIHVTATYESSAALTAQMLNGAGFDLFLSADMSYPRKIIAAGLGASAEPIPYAHGVLVLFTRRDSRWPQPTMELLRDPGLKRLAIADPARAPYGHAAMATLTNLGVGAALQPKLVTAANIAQAAQFAETGNADAGLISQTAAVTPTLRSVGSFVVVPQRLYPVIEQGAVVLAKSAERVNAQRMLDFLRSPEMQRQLQQSGLNPIAGATRQPAR